jgi:hypothetical protein
MTTNEGVGGDTQQKMELQKITSFSDGNSTMLEGGHGSWEHQEAPVQMDGCLGSGKV